MTKAEIYAGLTEIFQDIFDDDSLTINSEMTAEDIEEWDSVNHINLVIAVEMRFKIKFQAAEIEQLKNVGEFADLVGRKLGIQ